MALGWGERLVLFVLIVTIAVLFWAPWAPNLLVAGVGLPAFTVLYFYLDEEREKRSTSKTLERVFQRRIPRFLGLVAGVTAAVLSGLFATFGEVSGEFFALLGTQIGEFPTIALSLVTAASGYVLQGGELPYAGALFGGVSPIQWVGFVGIVTSVVLAFKYD